jgi:protein-tyrosine phosphatase
VVHCWAGESRTAFVLRSWPYQVRRNLDFEDELVRRERVRRAAPE